MRAGTYLINNRRFRSIPPICSAFEAVIRAPRLQWIGSYCSVSGPSRGGSRRGAIRPFRTIRACEAGADPYGANDNIVADAGYVRELHDRYPVSRFLASTTPSASGEVHREPLEIGERAVVEGAFVRSSQDYAGRLARLERFLPARRTQAPAIAGPQAGKAEFWQRRRQIIAAGFGKLEELSRHDRADGMTTDVFSTRIAASVSEEPRQGLHRAIFESVA